MDEWGRGEGVGEGGVLCMILGLVRVEGRFRFAWHIEGFTVGVFWADMGDQGLMDLDYG